MREFAKPLYKSKRWQQCRNAYAKSVGHLCENCLRQGIYKPGEIVHHIIHITPETINDPEVTFGWDNLELLCRDCHAEEHKKQYSGFRSKKRYKVDEDGVVELKTLPLYRESSI